MFRSIPINHQDILTDPYEYYANRDITKYKAVESMAFKLSSKLYDFQVTACPDDYWTDHVSKEAPYRAIDLPINLRIQGGWELQGRDYVGVSHSL